jgi:hypothetical protein
MVPHNALYSKIILVYFPLVGLVEGKGQPEIRVPLDLIGEPAKDFIGIEAGQDAKPVARGPTRIHDVKPRMPTCVAL